MSINFNRRKYIGGEFSSADLQSISLLGPSPSVPLYYPPVVKGLTRSLFETGSDSIAFILSAVIQKNITLWTPENFCFESLQRVQQKLPEKNITISRYSLIESISFSKDQNVLLIAYFNKYDERLSTLATTMNNNVIIIEDFTHAPLDINKTKADFSFCSLRKFVPVSVSVTYTIQEAGQSPDTIESAYLKLKKTGSEIKELVSADPAYCAESVYLTLFELAESQLKSAKIQLAHPSQIDAFNSIDFDTVLRRRKKNYQLLYHELQHSDPTHVILPGEYMYLIVITNCQKSIRKHLFDNGIFPAIHWYDSDSTISRKILSFHIDHRYNGDDMHRIKTALEVFRK